LSKDVSGFDGLSLSALKCRPDTMKRTHLPLNGLRVLDAAARHLSFTRAADELAVTPAAVGQQIRALEDTLGVVLFRRTAKGLELTPEGESGLDALRDGFLQFEEAVRAMQSQQSSKVLTIAAPRDFTAKWLAPRLAAYAKADSELRFHLIAADGDIDFTEANLDLAVIWAENSNGHEGVKLADGATVTIGEGQPIAWPGDPADAGSATLTVADAGLALDAALAGFGQARIPALLAGRNDGEPSARAYWLVAPTPQWRQKKVKVIVAALTGEA
jgi:LysR family transcriptional regulator, glycine cleavage system transcriptional activator